MSWQIVPAVLGDLLTDPDPQKARRVSEAVLKTPKLNVAGLKAARRALNAGARRAAVGAC